MHDMWIVDTLSDAALTSTKCSTDHFYEYAILNYLPPSHIKNGFEFALFSTTVSQGSRK